MAELIDLSKVPVPDIIQPLSFEQRFAALKQLLIDIDPSYEAVVALESDPITKLLQVFAYREMHLVAQINDATRGNILASSTGNDLIALGSRYNLAPLVIQAGDPTAVPPIPEILEDEQSFKRRVQMAFDGLNTAGSIDGYIFFALGADPRVADAKAVSPEPCEMVVTILSIEGDGTVSNELLIKVRDVFGMSADGLSQSGTPSKVRPQGDRVTIQGASIVNYSVQAVLQLLPGPDAQVVLAAANQALAFYQKEQRRLGADITRSGLFKALHQSGVNNVNLISPSADITVLDHQAAYCTSVNISIGASVNNRVASLLPPNASQLERDIEQVIASSLDLPLSIADLWDPFRCPLSLLPWLAWAYSVDQWADSWPESVKRQVVNDAFGIHRFKGTPYAVQRALNSLGIKTNILEWWESAGSNVRGTMKVLALVNDNITDDNDGLITAKMLAMVTEAIRNSKRGSIHFDVELGISFEESLTFAAGISPSVGISDIDADSNGVRPDDVLALAGVFGIEHRIDCIDTDYQLSPVLPDELLFTHNLAAVSHQLIISEHELTGVV